MDRRRPNLEEVPPVEATTPKEAFRKNPPVECLRTVRVLIPLLQNPTLTGLRFPVSWSLIRKTVEEFKRRFSGLTILPALGWCREDGVWDPSICIETDVLFSLETDIDLSLWKETLEHRFIQRSIYMRVSDPIRWI